MKKILILCSLFSLVGCKHPDLIDDDSVSKACPMIAQLPLAKVKIESTQALPSVIHANVNSVFISDNSCVGQPFDYYSRVDRIDDHSAEILIYSDQVNFYGVDAILEEFQIELRSGSSCADSDSVFVDSIAVPLHWTITKEEYSPGCTIDFLNGEGELSIE